MKRYSHLITALTWCVLVAIACTLYVRTALDDTAADPGIYVQSTSFHVISFFVMFGLPLFFILALMLFVVTKMTNRPPGESGEADDAGDDRGQS